jgi:hypothetical protein
MVISSAANAELTRERKTTQMTIKRIMATPLKTMKIAETAPAALAVSYQSPTSSRLFTSPEIPSSNARHETHDLLDHRPY